MFQIKICGITNPEDASMVAESGADAIGLNFYPASSRYVTPRAAEKIVETLPQGIVKVGLFVNSETATIRRIVDDLGLELIQLHGDESPERLAELLPRPVMKVFRPGPNGFGQIADFLADCHSLECMPRMVLIDANVANAFGGTGKLADWTAVRAYRAQANALPTVLAGGLRPNNVAEAIVATGVGSVDTASGVESSPGRKDPAAVAAFVLAARAAFAAANS